MLILMKQHGRIIIGCVISVLVLGIIFGIRVGGDTGFVRIAYKKAMGDRTDTDIADYTDAEAVEAVLARSKPEIRYSYTKVTVGKEADIGAMFLAEDADGNPVAVEITDILNVSGASILYETEEDRKNKKYTHDTAHFLFPVSGIYTLRVKAEDDEKRETYRQYKIPVSGS